MVFLFVLITFELILDGYLRIWTNQERIKSEIQDGGQRNDYVIMTPCDVITS